MMEIKFLNPTHAEEYRKLRLEALKNHPDAFASSFEEEKENLIELYQSRFNSDDSSHFGAFVDEKLVGVVTLIKEMKIKLKHRATIFAMYVSADKRGYGIGRSLMVKAINQAKEWEGIEQVYLSVVTTKESAKQLYSSLGFEVFGIEKRALKINNVYFDEALF
ncbi:MAG: N-acetyltransferase family protein [Bacillota bacterium]